MATFIDGDSLASGDGDTQNGKTPDESRVEDDDGRAHKKRMTVRHSLGPLEPIQSIIRAKEGTTDGGRDDRAASAICSATGRPYISLCQVYSKPIVLPGYNICQNLS